MLMELQSRFVNIMKFIRTYIGAISILLGLLFIAPAIARVNAATLNFDPSSIKVKEGETFDVDIVVNTADAEVYGVDALFQFDPNSVEATVVTPGTFLDVNHKEIKPEGKVYIVGLVNSPGEAVQGEDVLATVSFKAKKSSTSSLTYMCEINDTRESNVLEASTDSPDLLECGQNGKATIIVGDGTAVAPTSATTKSSTTTTKTGGSELPKTGVVDNMIMAVIVGGILFVIGLGARLLI